LFKQEDELPIEEPSALNADAKKHFLHRTIAGQHLDRPAAPRVPSGGKRTPHLMAEHLGRAPAISDRMPSWLLEALPRSTGGAKKTPATDLYCCKRLIIWKNVHYLKRGNWVESSLAILPIIVRLPLVLQRTSAAGTIYWSQM